MLGYTVHVGVIWIGMIDTWATPLLNITDVNLDEQGREQVLGQLSVVKWEVTEAC